MNSSPTASGIKAYHWILFIICFFSSAFAGIVSTLMSVYMPVAVRDLLGTKNGNELNDISAYINAIFIFGGAVGGIITGFAGDRKGRKMALIYSVACYGLFTVLTGLAPSWWTVVICRLMTGFGMGGMLVATNTMLIEEWPQKTRAIFIGFLSISIPIGIFSAGLIDYLIPAWRQAFQIGVIPIAISLLSIKWLRETEKWEKFNHETKRGLIKPAGLFASEYRADLVKGSIIFGSMLIGLWAIFSWVPTWIQSLMPDQDTQHERGISMMMLGMGGLTGGFLSGWLTNAIGLRRAMILCFLACTLLSFILFKTNIVFGQVIYLEIAVLALFFGASQGVLSVYIPNLFPVSIRAAATGFCFNTGRLVTATAVLFVGILVSLLGGYGNCLFIFSFVFVIGLAATLLSKKEAPHEKSELPSNSLLIE